MAKLIRKISIGKDYKNDAMHYAVGQEVYGGHIICDIIEEEDKYSDGTVNVNELIGFTPNSEYEFIVDGERLYRVLSKFITIKYEYQGDEKEYNPSWAQSS